LNLTIGIQYITGGLSLVAFIVAALFYAYHARLKQRTDMILAAPPNQRLAAIDGTADFLRVETSALSDKQKEKIIFRQLEMRGRRDQMLFVASLVLAGLLAIISLVEVFRDNSSKLRLTSDAARDLCLGPLTKFADSTDPNAKISFDHGQFRIT
jgi:hypothetical protein